MENNTLCSINQKILVNTLDKVKKFFTSKTIIPYMNYILIKVIDSIAWITVTDIENTATLLLNNLKSEQKNFSLCIENSLILPLSNQDIDISIQENENFCNVNMPNGVITIPKLDPNEFPEIDKEKKILFEINESVLYEILKKIISFTDDNIMLSNNSVHFYYRDKTLRIGATNRISCCSTSITLDAEEDLNFMLSKKSCMLVKNILNQNSNENCSVYNSKNDIIFETSLTKISCRQMIYDTMSIANDYFRLSMPFISNKYDVLTISDKHLLSEQLQKATVFNVKYNSLVIIKLEKNKITFEVEDKLIGRKSIQSLDVLFEHKGDTKKVILNNNELDKIIKNIDSDKFDINIPLKHGPNLDTIGEPLSISNSGYIYLLSPFS